ncbi:DUF3488 and transglutaminase-like domain-containing protein [Frondihabitans sp. PhB188]|uniref:transglutaminase TgpA family protein n=1 Tax=Frondihabitans sp. PhB188 TaxID=2485200 RepID=UPI0013158460|nr:DUF3488 and transglutaminase-like domain-containing protein [Frondihabitans sp. PhB188]
MPDRFAPGNARWGLTLVLWLTLLTSLASLHPLFQGSSWWFVPAVVSGLVFAASAAARAAHWPSAVASLAGLVVGLVASTVIVQGGTAIAGIIPTSDTVDRIRLLVQQAEDAIVSDQAPVVVGDALLAVIVVSVAAASVLLDVLARVSRIPGLTGVVFAVVILVPALIPNIDPAWVWVVATVLGYIAILLISTGRRPSKASFVTGLAGIVVAGIITALLPASLASPLTGIGTGTGISTGVNPVINLGKDLRRGDPVTVLTYSTSASTGQYLKLVDLVDFSGTRWSPSAVTLDSADSVDKLPAPSGVSAGTTKDTVDTDVSVTLLRSPYLPIPVPATKISGIGDAWKYVNESGVTIRSATQGSQGLDYSVTSKPVDPTTQQIIDALGEQSADMSKYLDVDGVPASITRLAKRETSGAANKFDAAVALQDYFRNGDFTYSEDTPVREGYDGSGLDMVETFLQRKSGYCVHFASAMAVMARTLGIPSRIAVGFLPGTQVGGSDDWTVTSNDLHTWPELYFQGLGWIPFEPTVGQGTTASYLTQTGTDTSPSASASATTEPSDTASAEATPTSTAASNAATATSTSSADAQSAGSGTTVGGVPLTVGAIAIVILLGMLPWWLRTSRRRRRLTQRPPDSALAAWREIVDTARDLGLPVDPAATPQQTSATLAKAVAPDDLALAAVDAVRRAVEEERFGFADQRAGTEAQDAAREAIRGLHRTSAPLARVRATVVPISLFVEARPRAAQGA